eukprot:2884428-Alexandrium_andersonii.AAC.1
MRHLAAVLTPGCSPLGAASLLRPVGVLALRALRGRPRGRALFALSGALRRTLPADGGAISGGEYCAACQSRCGAPRLWDGPSQRPGACAAGASCMH